MYPWEKSRSETRQVYLGSSIVVNRQRLRHGTPHIPTYKVVTEYLDDNPTMSLRKGDIIKFTDGFDHKGYSDWKEWFLTEEDKANHLPRDPKVPWYAMNQLAMVIGRYRKVKYKSMIFRDYGTVIIMLSGFKPGHVRRFWGCGCNTPFNLVSRFPELPKYGLLNMIPHSIKELYQDKYEDTNESRNTLISKVYNLLGGEFGY